MQSCVTDILQEVLATHYGSFYDIVNCGVVLFTLCIRKKRMRSQTYFYLYSIRLQVKVVKSFTQAVRSRLTSVSIFTMVQGLVLNSEPQHRQYLPGITIQVLHVVQKFFTRHYSQIPCPWEFYATRNSLYICELTADRQSGGTITFLTACCLIGHKAEQHSMNRKLASPTERVWLVTAAAYNSDQHHTC